MYLNEIIINHILQILYNYSPFSVTRYFLHTYFMEVIKRSTTNLHRTHRNNLNTLDGLSLSHKYLLILIIITPTNWILLVCHTKQITDTSTISHDLLPCPLKITETKTHLKYYDTVLQLDPGFTINPIRYVPAVH